MKESDLGTVVATADGSLTLAHPQHGECYHTRAGALAEARLLYAESSGFLAACLEATPSPKAVLDIGLGLGLNAVATLGAWWSAPDPGPLELISLEIEPALVKALASGRAAWQENWSQVQKDFCLQLKLSSALTYTAAVVHPRSGHLAQWRIHLGDAATQPIPKPRQGPTSYHYMWQDPFSPEKNPSMWGEPWFARLAGVARPGCVLMSYSVAGAVRRAAESGGWRCERIPALLPGKRAWLKATKPY